MNDESITVFIGNTDIYEWVMGAGKEILMPKLLSATIDLINNDLETKLGARVKVIEDGKRISFDFVVRKENIDDTLDKIMIWALEVENYEMCSEIKKIQDKLYTF